MALGHTTVDTLIYSSSALKKSSITSWTLHPPQPFFTDEAHPLHATRMRTMRNVFVDRLASALAISLVCAAGAQARTHYVHTTTTECFNR